MPRLSCTAAGLAVLLILGGAPAPALASQDTPGPAEKKAAKSKKTPQAVRPPKLAPGGSGETTAERSARLRRECKGRPNAGACTGYTD